jgi:hypothetical protein
MQLRSGLGAGNPSGSSEPQSAALKAAMEEAADDRVMCKFCGRKFNDNAAARHIAFCETKTKKD